MSRYNIHTEGVATTTTAVAGIHDLRQKRVHTIELVRLPMWVSFRVTVMINDWTHSTSDPRHFDIPWTVKNGYFAALVLSIAHSIFIPFLPYPSCIWNASRLRIHWYIASHPSPVSEQELHFSTTKTRKKKNQCDFLKWRNICNAQISLKCTIQILTYISL